VPSPCLCPQTSHLLTMPLERELRSAEDCLGRLRELEEQGRVWGQDVILEVKDQELVLSDVESKEELEAFPLGSVQGCSAGLDNAVLAISVQERNPPRTSVLLFQCERLGVSPERGKTGGSHGEPQIPALPGDGNPKSRHSLAMGTPNPGTPWRWEPQIPALPGYGNPKSRHSLAMGTPNPGISLAMGTPNPGTPRLWEPHSPPPPYPQEILNHVLGDLERFVGRLKTALSSASTKKKLKKPGGKGGEGPWGLLGVPVCPARCQPQLCPSSVLGHCPSPGLAPAVQSPLLLPEALQLLEETLGDEDYGVWKSLGTAWNKSRAEYPNSERVPAYTPVFSDGWLPPVMEQERRGSLQDTPARASVSPAQLWALMQPLPTPRSALPAQGLVRALYDFQARNSQELSVRKGDTLQVLDQQRKWWLVQDERGDRGHVPGNILEPLPEPGHSSRQVGDPSALPSPPPTLHPSSSPAEVTAWLMDKGFSRITVRTLGVLRGHELLQMSPAELRGVCPEEWRRVLFKLSPIRTSLGATPMSPSRPRPGWSPLGTAELGG
uniref:Uncharacterized protein n=1 Tax=Geospiza parvula TaxID=87175 RepID=A0A8U8B8E0_GEOPR